jgi:hypothetical protein
MDIMEQTNLNRRNVLLGAAVTAAAILPFQNVFAQSSSDSVTFTKTATPGWLLAFWKEIDDKTWGKGFDCFTEHAEGTLGVGHWQGREAIRANLRAFVDKQMTTHHDVVEYWDGGRLKVFRGFVTMKFDDPSKGVLRPAMTHFFYMDEADPSKVRAWYGSVGPVEF